MTMKENYVILKILFWLEYIFWPLLAVLEQMLLVLFWQKWASHYLHFASFLNLLIRFFVNLAYKEPSTTNQLPVFAGFWEIRSFLKLLLSKNDGLLVNLQFWQTLEHLNSNKIFRKIEKLTRFLWYRFWKIR